nr:unnamed protein product [Callosobruchus analis]
MVDSELLINEVQKRPVLWDTTNKNKKNTAWAEVCTVLLEDFEAKTDSEQRNLVQDITSKWRSIRDNYIRNRRKIKESTRSGAAAKKFEEQLRFLEKSIAMRPTVSTISEESQSSQQNAEDDTENSGPEESEEGQQAVGTIITPTTSKSAPIKRTKKIGIEEHLLNFMEAHKPKNAHQPILEDDDLAFYFSLLPMVKSLTIDEKYTFRMDSMKLLQEIKKSRNTPRSKGVPR